MSFKYLSRKQRKRNEWIWQEMRSVHYLQLLVLSGLLVGCDMGHAPLTLEQASKLTLNAKVDGVPFNVPINYHFGDFRVGREWPHPTEARLEGKERPSVDVIKVTALLPDLAPYTALNSNRFEDPGRGDKVDIYMTHRASLEIKTLDLRMPRLKKLPEDARVPGFLRFEDPSSKADEYFNNLQVGYDMINIRCSKPEIDPRPPASPSCTVLAGYRKQFTVMVTFGFEHLPIWREILDKSERLLNHFVATAEADSKITR